MRITLRSLWSRFWRSRFDPTDLLGYLLRTTRTSQASPRHRSRRLILERLESRVVPTNNPPTGLYLSNHMIQENQPSGTAIGTFMAMDLDVDDEFTFALVSGNGSEDNGSFSIAGDQLNSASSFNFEAKSAYQIRVRVTDLAGATFESALTISVTNVNEPPVIAPGGPFSVPEDAALNTVVGSVTASDPDIGGMLMYSIAGGPFSIDMMGQIKVSGALNFEATPAYNVTVTVTDMGMLAASCGVTINVTDVNEPPTIAPAGPFTVPE